MHSFGCMTRITGLTPTVNTGFGENDSFVMTRAFRAERKTTAKRAPVGVGSNVVVPAAFGGTIGPYFCVVNDGAVGSAQTRQYGVKTFSRGSASGSCMTMAP